MRPVVVLRPEPGNADTAQRIEAAGLAAIRMPVFATRSLAWTAPDPASFDALLVTSAQAIRLAGDGLRALSGLPVVAVGEATAAVVRDAGLTVGLVGASDAADAIALARASGYRRLLHLAGRDRTASTCGIEAVSVYESVQTHVPEIAPGNIVLLHSTRAAQVLAAAPVARDVVCIVAISAAVRAAAGEGWRAARIAATPDDAAMVAAAYALAIDPLAGHGDNAA